QIERNEFNLTKMLNNLEDTFLPEAVKNRVILRVDIDRGIPQYLIGPDEKLDQVLSNLVQNALRFTEVGKVTITAQLVKRQGNKLFILFRIKDTGLGISEQKQHMFNNFDNIDLSTIRQFGETGVNLAVSKLLVRLMGGDLELYSEEGKGS
ncbi:ATP-binding protein, partial [Arthrospira platensis SPKY1]|nr:ATP-binding protein [Arthrospira platensis SPKY1]